jgi:gliding motility associated protien GldN
MRLFSLLLIGLLQILCFSPYMWAETVPAMNTSQEASPQGEGDFQTPPVEQTEPGPGDKNNPYLEFNPNSVGPIPQPYIMFKKRVWREIYLKERQNRPFFTRDKEITKLIIEGVKSGVLTPYTNDSLAIEMPIEQFFENLGLPKEEGLSADEKALGFTDDAGWDNKKAPTSVVREEEYFFPNEITTLELMEDVIFDKMSSRLIYDIQCIKLIIPADKFPTGLRRVVATFKYKDLAAYFDSMPKEAVWVNVKNNAGNIKLTEAFELRKFSSRIVKIENPDDANVDDIYNKTPKSGLIASQQLEEELIELEYFLWEN